MSAYYPTNQNYHLPIGPPESTRPIQPIGSGTVGAIYELTPSQILAVTTGSPRPQSVTLTNVGSIALTVSSTQSPYPRGMRLVGGIPLRFVTSSPLYVSAPPISNFDGVAQLYPSISYVSVTVEQ